MAGNNGYDVRTSTLMVGNPPKYKFSVIEEDSKEFVIKQQIAAGSAGTLGKQLQRLKCMLRYT
jgi:hypothetical protein